MGLRTLTGALGGRGEAEGVRGAARGGALDLARMSDLGLGVGVQDSGFEGFLFRVSDSGFVCKKKREKRN